jgi:hypothetical protein
MAGVSFRHPSPSMEAPDNLTFQIGCPFLQTSYSYAFFSLTRGRRLQHVSSHVMIVRRPGLAPSALPPTNKCILFLQFKCLATIGSNLTPPGFVPVLILAFAYRMAGFQ